MRTDPLVFSQTGPCLSDHVHRFYGAVSDRTMRPEVTFADLRAATGNTGNVEENKSLYWNPAIYKADLYAMFDDTRTKRLLATTLQTLSNTSGSHLLTHGTSII